MSKSITSKLIILLTLCTTAILAAGITIDYRLSRNEIMTRLQVESAQSIKGAVSDLENWLQNVQGTTKLLGRILQQREYSLTGLDQMLRDVVRNNEEVYGATIALNPELVEAPEGFAPYYFHQNNALGFADLTEGDDPYWRRTWYVAAVTAGEPVWVEPYLDVGGAEVLMTTYSVPVYRTGEEGRRFLYGVVTADVPLDGLHRFLQHLRLGDSGFGILLSREGIILSARDPAAIMQHHLNVVEEESDATDWKNLVQGALAGQVMTSQLKCPDTSGQCTIRLSTLESTGWPLGVIYAEDELLAPLRSYQIKIALLGLVTVLALALVVTLVTRRLTRPLTALAHVTDQISHGNFDVSLPRTQGEDEVARLIRAFAAMSGNLKTYVEDLAGATAARSRVEGELAAASEIQMAMLPQGGEALVRKGNYSLWATVRPAKTVGGDLYTYYTNDSQHLFIALGDVSDKGVPAALFMAKTISHIQQFSEAFSRPAQGMALLNNALEAGNSNCMFVTLFFGVLNLNSLELRFSSAGHTPPSLVRDGRSEPVAQESGPALGLAADLEFPENAIQLKAGDRLAIYTDGIDEAFNADAEMFTCERMNRELERTRSGLVAAAGIDIIAAVESFAGATPQSDDIALMLLDLPGKARALKPTKLSGSFELGPRLASRTGEWIQGQLSALMLDDVLIMELMLVAEEVVTNIDKYAGLPGGGVIDIVIEATETELHLQFSDAGIAFNPLVEAKVPVLGASIEAAEVGGLGVHLIGELTDKQHYQRLEQSNVLRVTRLIG